MDITESLKFLCEVVQLGPKGQTVRNDIIARANEMASAISSVAIYTTARLNDALLTKDTSEKLRKLTAITQEEIRVFAGMNNLCAQIYGSANALHHAFSTEWANTKLFGQADARELFVVLAQGEQGMQELFAGMMAMPQDLQKKSDQEINDWIRQTISGVLAISSQANSVMAKLSNAI
jgi:hypothetical protein